MANQLEPTPKEPAPLVEFPQWRLFKELPGNNPPISMRLHLMGNGYQSLGFIEQAPVVHTYQVHWNLHVMAAHTLGVPEIQTFTSLEEAMGVLRVLSPKLMEMI